MSRDGSGVMSWPSGGLAISGQPVSSTAYNAFRADLLDDLNTPRPITMGGTGAATAAAARTALGAMAADATLTALASILTATGKIPYATGVDTVSEADSQAYGRSLLNAADEATLKALVNLEIGTDVQAYDADTAKTDVATDWTAAQSIPLKAGNETAGTLTAASKNDAIPLTGNITAPSAVFAALEWVAIDPGTSNRTVTRGSGLTLYVNGTDSASATILANTQALLYYRSATVAILSGPGVS